MPFPRLSAALLAAVSLAVAGCGDQLKESGIPDGSETGQSAAPAPTGTTPAAPVEDAAKTYAKGTAVEPVKNAQDLEKKPGIPKPSGEPGKALVVKDLVVGKGPEAKSGDALTVRYVGVSYSTGKQFDASWSRPDNMFPLTLGQGAVIPGWDKGIVGMKAGGRRELVIPPDLGYGDTGQGKDIKPGETLVFVIDLKKIG
jgi:peptidylprolyl isomerase